MVVVTAVPDEKKGERLIVVHKPLTKSVDQVLTELNARGPSQSVGPLPRQLSRSGGDSPPRDGKGRLEGAQDPGP